MTGFVSLDRSLPVWELLYNLWAEWFWSFTCLEIATLVPCVALGSGRSTGGATTSRSSGPLRSSPWRRSTASRRT